MFEYYSNVDINRAIRSGELRFDPDIDKEDQLGAASVDMPIQWIKEVDIDPKYVEKLKKLKGESRLGYLPYSEQFNIERLPKEEREKILFRRLLNRDRKVKFTERHFEELTKSSKLIHPKTSPDGKGGKFWYLSASKIYIAQHRPRLFFPKDIEIDVSRRSSAARCGLDSLGAVYEYGALKETLLPYVDIRIYTNNCISQVSFRRKVDSINALLEELIKDRRTSIRRDKELVRPTPLENHIGFQLTLDPVVNLFTGTTIDPKHVDKKDYVPFDLKKGLIPYSYSFMLARAREHVKIGPQFTGIIHAFAGMPIGFSLSDYSLESSINAANVWPYSNHTPTYEVGGDRNYIFNKAKFNSDNVTTFLEINKVRTPAAPDKRATYGNTNGMLPRR